MFCVQPPICSAIPHLYHFLPSYLHLPIAVRVFPVKAYAFVNYADIGSAIKAMQAVDGRAIPQLTGVPQQQPQKSNS